MDPSRLRLQAGNSRHEFRFRRPVEAGSPAAVSPRDRAFWLTVRHSSFLAAGLSERAGGTTVMTSLTQGDINQISLR